jgi:hypothetical protein
MAAMQMTTTNTISRWSMRMKLLRRCLNTNSLCVLVKATSGRQDIGTGVRRAFIGSLGRGCLRRIRGRYGRRAIGVSLADGMGGIADSGAFMSATTAVSTTATGTPDMGMKAVVGMEKVLHTIAQ